MTLTTMIKIMVKSHPASTTTTTAGTLLRAKSDCSERRDSRIGSLRNDRQLLEEKAGQLSSVDDIEETDVAVLV